MVIRAVLTAPLSAAAVNSRRQRLDAVAFCLLLAACNGVPAPVNHAPEGTIVFDAYLWQAARQTVEFLPLERADPMAGLIETGWGSPRGDADDLYKARIELDYSQIYSRAAAVTVEHRIRSGDGWLDVGLEGVAAKSLADAIGESAGELRLEKNPGN